MGESAPGQKVAAVPAAAAPGARPAEPIPPALLNSPDYGVIREINRGGMGVVYLARNRRMDRLEGLKLVSESLLKDTGAVERFEGEMRSAARLNHQNISAMGLRILPPTQQCNPMVQCASARRPSV
jgi:serine/threonine protein kinase